MRAAKFTENQLFINQNPGNGGFIPWNPAAIPSRGAVIPRNGEMMQWKRLAIPVSGTTIPWKDKKKKRNDDLIPNNQMMQQGNGGIIPAKNQNSFY